MLDAVKEALAFTANKRREDLDNNRMLTLAIIKELEIIGEAASKLTSEFKAGQSHIPWTDIVGMRNFLRMVILILIWTGFGILFWRI